MPATSRLLFVAAAVGLSACIAVRNGPLAPVPDLPAVLSAGMSYEFVDPWPTPDETIPERFPEGLSNQREFLRALEEELAQRSALRPATPRGEIHVVLTPYLLDTEHGGYRFWPFLLLFSYERWQYSLKAEVFDGPDRIGQYDYRDQSSLYISILFLPLGPLYSPGRATKGVVTDMIDNLIVNLGEVETPAARATR